MAYFSGEGNKQFRKSVSDWCKHNSVDINDMLFFKYETGVVLDDETVKEISEELKDVERRHGNIKLVIFDTLDRTLSGE